MLASRPERSKVTPIASNRSTSRIRSLGPLDQPAPGHLADPRALQPTHRLERVALARAQPPRLHLAERQRLAVEGDDVQLAPAGPVVALDDLKAALDQVLGREVLAGPAELTGGGRCSRPGRYAESCDVWVSNCANSAQRSGARLRRIGTPRDPRVTRLRVASGACSLAPQHSRSTASIRARCGSRSTSAPACPRSRSSASATPPCGSHATGSAPRSSTPASRSPSGESPPISRPRSCARSAPASTPRWRSRCWPRAARFRPRRWRAMRCSASSRSEASCATRRGRWRWPRVRAPADSRT